MIMRSKFVRVIINLFTKNLSLKALAILFAFILWSFVITETNPERTKTIAEIPVTVSGLSLLEESGLTLRDSFSEEPINVTVKISVPHSDMSLADKSIVSASIDVSKLTTVGSNSLPVNISFSNVANVTLVSVKPSSIAVTVDTISQTDIPLELNPLNALDENLVSVSPVFPATVRIKGSSYYVDSIFKGVIDVDMSTLEDGKIISSNCRFEDANGNTIKFNSDPVTVDMDIQTVKSVKLDLTDVITNEAKVASGYQFNGISAGTVKICGHASVLNGITGIPIEKIDLSEKDSSFTSAEVKLILPEGISLVESEDAPTVNIDIIPAQKSLNVTRKVTITGLNGPAEVKSASDIFNVTENGLSSIEAQVVLMANSENISLIKPTDVNVFLDLSSVNSDGTAELHATVPSSLKGKVTAQVISPKTVTVKFK